MTDDSVVAPFGPWNPGIVSQVPERLLHLCTIFRPENTFTTVAEALELRDLTGLALPDLVAFRPERLALHELLIRVTADLSVPDGSRIEDLGINFREIVRAILRRHVEPEMPAIVSAYDTLRRQVAALVESELSALYLLGAGTSAPSKQVARRAWLGLFTRHAMPDAREETSAVDARHRASEWETRARASSDSTGRAALLALAKVVSALLVRHGRVWGSRELVSSLATDIACNDCAGEAIGRLIDPLVANAVAREGFRVLPSQAEPVVMNTKGPSASGKSTLRPLQKRLAGEIGVDWSEFALISPDIWRKQLLDYASLGADYKYAGAFTGDELAIIDQKLDRYIARKAERGTMTHLLIDRFRFDSFAPDSDEPGSNLLTRFGRIVYLFFMITPPASLVERAWKRGLDVGRYKAVDDTLAHAVEAYAGMPQLFFTWIARADKRVHFEFLDNSVPMGERPRTVAFGTNDTLNVLDVKGLLDIDRFRRIDVNATAPELLYPKAGALAPERNAGFLRQCVGRFRRVNFADQATGRVYLHLVGGVPLWRDRAVLDDALRSDETRAGLAAAVPGTWATDLPGRPESIIFLDASPHGRIQTLGRWGGGV